jgi:hypothetical protein
VKRDALLQGGNAAEASLILDGFYTTATPLRRASKAKLDAFFHGLKPRSTVLLFSSRLWCPRAGRR